jgi:hypothetical protein
MGFNNFARRVRDTSLPYGRRVVSLRSCVQLYRPIGFEATVGYLEATSGPFREDETSLLRALDMITESRELWQADVRGYAVLRAEAKRRGRRVPRPAEGNPLRPAFWYGARREAALYALAHWLGRGSEEHRDDELGRAVARLAAVCVATGGALGEHEWDTLGACAVELERRVIPRRWQDARTRYYEARELRFAVHLMRTAAPDEVFARTWART